MWHTIRKDFTTRTTRAELMVGLLISILVPAILINLFYYSELKRFMRSRAAEYNQEIIKQNGQRIESLLDQISITTNQLISTSITSEEFKHYDDKSPIERLETVRRMEKVLKDTKSSLPHAAELFLIGNDKQVYNTSVTIDKAKLLSEAEQADFVPLPVIPDYYLHSTERPVWMIPFEKLIHDYNNNTTVNTVRIDLYYSALEGIMDDLFADGTEDRLLILNSRDDLIYSSQSMGWDNTLGRGLSPGQLEQLDSLAENSSWLTVTYPIQNSDWRIIAYISNQSYAMQSRQFSQVFLFIVGLSLVLSVLLSYTVSRSITRPISNLINKMTDVGSGKFVIAEINSRNQDILVLASSFNAMVHRIDQLMKITLEKERENTQIQLKALEAQINPHFLYNTLEVIRSIALDHKVGSIAQISKSLARMFRYSISRGSEFVTLGEEIAHIQNYIFIQKQRYGDKFEVLYEISSPLLEERIAKFILQPLIENSIYHGIERKIGSAVIVIRAAVEGGDLLLGVHDTGVGMNAAQVRELNGKLCDDSADAGPQSGTGHGIGVANVNARIKLYYGRDYGVRIESRPEQGTTVELRIPLSDRTKEDTNGTGCDY